MGGKVNNIKRVMLRVPMRDCGMTLAPGEHGVVSLAMLDGLVYAVREDGSCDVVRDWVAISTDGTTAVTPQAVQTEPAPTAKPRGKRW